MYYSLIISGVSPWSRVFIMLRKLVATLKWFFQIEAEKKLFENQLFWTAAFVPLLIFCIISIPIWIDLCCHFDLSASGYFVFSESFKFPIAILGLSFSFLVLVVAHHRSMQSSRAMELQEAQNKFVNYINHVKFFEDRFDVEGQDELKFFPGKDELSYIHNQLYPFARDGDFRPASFVGKHLSALDMLNRTSFPKKKVKYALLAKVVIACSLVHCVVGEESFKTLSKIAELDLRKFLSQGIRLVSTGLRHAFRDGELVLIRMKRQFSDLDEAALPSDCSFLNKSLLENETVYCGWVSSILVPMCELGVWDDLEEGILLLQQLQRILGNSDNDPISEGSVGILSVTLESAKVMARRYK